MSDMSDDFREHWYLAHDGEVWDVPCEFQIDDLVQDCSNSSALAMELLQSCT